MKLRTFALIMAVCSFGMMLGTDGLLSLIWFFQMLAWALVHLGFWPEVRA